ncbi:MAG: flagellar assembly protein FliW [Deltaproteobacteria bacterium]|nr:flagellar assembly protein FliW [Deltaproteobacteria bacterium]
MKITTTRFGDIDVKESEFITLHGSILGFEHLREFVLLSGEQNTPFWWLQSVQEPAVAFVVINPQIVKPDYAPAISEDDFEFLDIKKKKDIALLAIMTIRSNPLRITVNLRAPILINARTRKANQIILADSEIPIQYDVLDNKEHLNKDLLEEGTHHANGLAMISPSV